MRWMINRKRTNIDHELLQVIIVYAAHENKEVVKRENKIWSYERECVRCS